MWTLEWSYLYCRYWCWFQNEHFYKLTALEIDPIIISADVYYIVIYITFIGSDKACLVLSQYTSEPIWAYCKSNPLEQTSVPFMLKGKNDKLYIHLSKQCVQTSFKRVFMAKFCTSIRISLKLVLKKPVIFVSGNGLAPNIYRQVLNIRHTKSQHLKYSRTVLRLS